MISGLHQDGPRYALSYTEPLRYKASMGETISVLKKPEVKNLMTLYL